jgi:hypothetical protein
MTSSSTKPASATAAANCSAFIASACWSSRRWPDALALGQRLLIALLAGLFEAAQVVVDAFEQSNAPRPVRGRLRTRSVQCDLAFVLQRLHRRIALGELRGQFAQARVQLSALAAHALQRLASATICTRCDSSVSASACAASRDSRAAACHRGPRQLAALGVQRLPGGFQIPHRG